MYKSFLIEVELSMHLVTSPRIQLQTLKWTLVLVLALMTWSCEQSCTLRDQTVPIPPESPANRSDSMDPTVELAAVM